jgi:chromosome partitioning protein
MVRLLIATQKGGDAKTTTTLALARYFADGGCKVLVIDIDPQGHISTSLGLRAGEKNLHNFLIKNHTFKDCIVAAHRNIDVLNSSRDTVTTEATLMGHMGRELTFRNVFPSVDKEYDVVLIDSAPSISLLQTCAMIYTEQLLIPVSMDILSLQGAAASIETARTLNGVFGTNIQPIALLPVKVDRRYQITTTILSSLDDISKRLGVPVLPAIRTDSTPPKATRERQFLVDYDPHCKAAEDYANAFHALKDVIRSQLNGKLLQKEA